MRQIKGKYDGMIINYDDEYWEVIGIFQRSNEAKTAKLEALDDQRELLISARTLLRIVKQGGGGIIREIVIKSCVDCHYFNSKTLVCEHENGEKRLGNNLIPPDWCPLKHGGKY